MPRTRSADELSAQVKSKGVFVTKRDVIAGRVWITKVALLAATVWCSSAVGAELQQAMTAFSAGKADVVISQDGEDYLRVGLAAWGPNWAWTGFDGPSRGEQGSTLSTLSAKLGGKGVPVHLTFQASQPAPTDSYSITNLRPQPIRN